MSAMLKREQKLRQSPSCQRAIALPLSSRHEINRQIRLRVVREFNLPDAVADLLENAACYCTQEDEDTQMGMEEDPVPAPSSGKAGPPSCAGGLPPCFGRNMTFPRGPSSAYTVRHELPAVVTEGDAYRGHGEPESSSCSDGHLSDIMPDVAMATASFGQLQLQEQQELELDLGDGTSHLHNPLSPPPPHPIHPLLPHPLPHGGYHRYLGGPGPPPSYLHHRPSPGHMTSGPYHTGPPRFI